MNGKAFMPRSLWPFPKLTPLLGFWRLQLFLLCVALAISGIYWLLQEGNHSFVAELLVEFVRRFCHTVRREEQAIASVYQSPGRNVVSR